MAIERISQAINEIVSNTIVSAVTVAPRIFWALIIAAAGWLAAWLLKKITLHTVHGLDQYLERKAAQKGLRYVHIRRPLEKLIGDVIFWISLIFFFILAIQVLQLALLSSFLDDLVKSLPMLAMGILIIAVSFSIGSICRQIVASAFEAMGIEQADIFGNATRLFVVVVGILLGIAQIGIDISFLATVISVSFGAVLGALALAFGLGAQSYVANILAAAQVRKVYRNGDTVAVDGVKGKVTGISSTMITLQSEEGQVTVPAKVFLEKQSRLQDQEGTDAP